MSIENRSLKLPHSSGVLCGQKRSIFGEGIVFSFPFLIRFWLTAPVPKKGAKPYNFLKLNDPNFP